MNNNLCPTCQSTIPADAPGGICPACALLGVANPTSATQVAGASVPMLDEIAAAFPELEVLEMCGQGGMGVVFKARQPKLDRLVALKILTPVLAAQSGFAERFTREARALAKLSHPNIVAVHDFGESGGFFYLVMEFVDGVNLRQAIRSGISPEQALLLVPKVCEALQFAHDHGVLHRAIKPENILLDTRGNPKLADFGIAKLGDDNSTGLTLSGAQLGTAAYMAPEQIEHPATVDHRADIYSLGVVLYEMLTGELPLGRFAAPSEKAHCSSGVDDVVLRALEKQRERRQQSATEMKTQVEGAATSAAAPVSHAVAGGKTEIPWSRSAVWGAALAACSVPFGILCNSTIARDNPLETTTGFSVIFFALAPALAGTLLGWKAVSDLRFHRGHLRGGGAAVVGALFIPIFTVVGIVALSFDDIMRAVGGMPLTVVGLLVAVTIITSVVAAGIWAVKSLWRFVHDGPPGVPVHRPAVAAAVPPPSRVAPFSRAAAAGASLCIASIPVGFILYLFAKVLINPSLDTQSQLNGPVAGNIIIFGFIPALIGIALGWKAVGDFRYHRGHLRGGGTAVFAALGIPVLALVTTAVVNFREIDHSISPSRRNPEGAIVASIVVLAAVAASVWAVKALWKFVHHGPPGVPVNTDPASPWSRRIPWLVLGFTVIPGIMLGLALMLPVIKTGGSRRQSVPESAGPVTSPKAGEDRATQLARELVAETQKRMDAGIATPLESVAALQELAVAEARGDELKIAAARVRFLESHLNFVKQKVQAGVVPEARIRETEKQLLEAREELEKMQKLESEK